MCIYMYKIYIKQKYVTLHSIEYLKVSPRPQATNAFIHGSIPPFSLHLGTLAVSVNGFSYRSICSLPRIKIPNFTLCHLDIPKSKILKKAPPGHPSMLPSSTKNKKALTKSIMLIVYLIS